MYIANYLTETQKGVFERKEQIENANCIYEINDAIKLRVENILKADKSHYERLLPVVKEQIPELIGEYEYVTAVGGGFPKFELTILQTKNGVVVMDMNTELYFTMEPMFRKIFNTDLNIDFEKWILSTPFDVSDSVICDCVTFVHFLEHMPNWETVKEWINLQTSDIVIYMPCIEAAKDEHWFHWNDQHNVFFTVEAIVKVGESAGYTCQSLRYSDDMLIWFKR